MDSLCHKYPQYFSRPSESWIQQVHLSKESSLPNLYDAYHTTLPHQFKYSKNSVFASKTTEILKKICFDNVIVQHIRKHAPQQQVYYEKHPLRNHFIGPFTKDIGRKDFKTIKEEKYWLAENSHSIRVMMLSLYRSRFPRWIKRERRVAPEGGINPGDEFIETVFCLKDNCALETAHCYATSGEIEQNVTIQLHDGEYEFDAKKLTLTRKESSNSSTAATDASTSSSAAPDAQQQQSSSTGDDNNKQQSDTTTSKEENTPMTDEDSSSNTAASSSQQQKQIQLERKTGWSFSYLIDENYDFFLCQDEFIFPTYESMKFETPEVVHQSVLLLDGELVFNMKEDRYNYFITDVITYCISNPNKRHEMNVVSALGRPTSEKYSHITKYILEPHYYYYKKKDSHIPLPPSMSILRKKLYEKNQINEIFQCITKDPESGDYFYKEMNQNDGIKFVPESEQHFTFGPGVNDHLLQWTWPEKRRFHLEVRHLHPPEQRDPEAKKLMMKLYYGFSVYVPHLSRISVERLFFRDANVDITLLNDEERAQLLKEESFPVAELSFSKKGWKMHALRNDLERPSSFHTIINTFTQLIQGITSDDIKNAILDIPPIPVNSYLGSTYVTAYMIRKDAAIHLRVKTKYPSGNRPAYSLNPAQKPYEDIILQTYHVVAGKDNWVWRTICSIKDCEGPNGETGDELEGLAYLREQQMRTLSYAKCVFLPQEGTWKIIDFSGWEEECCCSKVLTHLEQIQNEVSTLRKKGEARMKKQ